WLLVVEGVRASRPHRSGVPPDRAPSPGDAPGERGRDARTPWRSIAALAGAVAVAAIVAAPFLAPFAEAVTKSRRYQELQANPQLNADVPFSDFPSTIVLFQPHFFGHLPNDKPWSTAPAAESISGFAGALGVAAWFALLLRAIALRRFRERELFFVLAGLFVLGVILDWPGVGSFFHFVFRL